MRSSHVGSFPLGYSFQNVRRVLEDLAFLGIDVPPYPQLRGFVDIYVSPLIEVGIVRRVEGFMRVVPDALNIQSLKNLRVPEAELSISFVRDSKLAFDKLRAPVTGVFTLASRLYLSVNSTDLSSTMLTNKELVKDFLSEYVIEFVKYLTSLGYEIVFLDEPFLGLMIGSRKNLFNYSDDDIVEILENVAGASKEAEIGIHVCGRIHNRLLELLARVSRVRYLSFEFHDNPKNVEVLNKHVLEEHDKIISPGIVSSRIPEVENYNDVSELLKKVYEKSGGRIDLVSADCGFAGLRGSLGNEEKEYELSLSKIERVVRAVRVLKNQILKHT